MEMNIESKNFGFNSAGTSINMNLNFNDSNIVNNEQRPSVFNNTTYKPFEWNQITPQPLPWAQNPASLPQIMTFGTQVVQTQQSNSQNQQKIQNQSVLQQQSLMPSNSNPIHKQTVAHNSLASFSQFSSQIKSYTACSNNSMMHCKRKSDTSSNAPSKQHITEERMAAHMSRLHISSETPAENITEQEPPTEREKRLVMCAEMRRLQTDCIIPAALLNRLERPCMAVMLWQPPQRLPGELPPLSSRLNILAESNDNNNTSSIDLNTNRNGSSETEETETMDMDV